MEYKEREKPIELEVLEILDARMQLSEKDQQHHYNLKKGYEGELAFDELTRNLRCDCLVLNDLLLQVGSTTFQIDTLLIADMLYLFEVKNHEGDFYYDNDRILTKANYEITNPVNQISRSESLLRQLLQTLSVTTQINSSVVFINPAFTLYQAPLDKPFILPTQVNRYMKQLDSLNARITNKHRAFADRLVSMHMTESPFKRLPEYSYGELRKGVVCRGCGSWKMIIKWTNCICMQCNKVVDFEETVLRSIQEFTLLFPSRKLTTKEIYDWCGGIASLKTFSRVLEKNFNKVGNRRWTYFE
jgi:hypothetical protein